MKNGKPWLVLAVAFIGGVLGGALATMLVAGDAFAVRHVRHTKTIEAERFVLLGRNGDQRGVMRVSDKGTAALYFNDETGKERGEFRVTADGRASVGFYDADGRKRVVIGQGPKQAGMGIFDQDGSQVATISSSSNGEVSMTLYDAKSGLARAGLGLSAKGTPALVLFDQDGKDRAELNLNAEGKPGLALADANGKTIAGLPMQSSPAQ
jgi:hypothetical protein